MKRTEKYLLSKVENINFVPIAYQDDLSKVIKSKNKMKIESSIYLDYTGKIFERQNIKATPTVMILNSNNEIIFSGFRPPRQIHPTLKVELAEDVPCFQVEVFSNTHLLNQVNCL
jgi:hypothetical protein